MKDTVSSQPEAERQGLTREGFFADMIGELAGALEEVIGLEDAAGFVAMVGNRMGDDLSDLYAGLPGFPTETPEDIGRICVDLKEKISGTFTLDEATEDRLIFTNCDCPFGKRVEGRPSLCMMTTNVFGRIAANATGYARVHVSESIAAGHARCRVELGLKPDDNANGHEFFR
ncbi:transcriptional regulator [Sulfitobacter pseudonitzschiae]|uniref:Transcriptional regulator n=1 Tax=Pseudosulfitobacter pseudonitzschiae TaxID=1402135 RepID=A0A9Q2RUV7_9RHOB|nr:methanogen output domain 1-containing protein [Pseudosulfitobacter pseudonitzschiae]MBM2292372.1 transcriptional regulator [Pseudosulfitobacter pseudonitzschiae]MBM2297290.1 transcriptional regulator [Pseudosulfitobacter pseudonitzschiae]MBM2302204.1 transcriptional regulator [Pseudosulfitobacter pseudonitzschiae]MBM2311986.1 transcriptional regulator [Pseudosulfitobacter pseudonitzschiae]MBM2316900.1 transcriptional regulator [Pseudosulfitobacter pseudonitzschiae]